jgi:hypothetical protein
LAAALKPVSKIAEVEELIVAIGAEVVGEFLQECLVGFRIHGLQVLQLGLLVWIQFDPAEGPGYRATRKRRSGPSAQMRQFLHGAPTFTNGLIVAQRITKSVMPGR